MADKPRTVHVVARIGLNAALHVLDRPVPPVLHLGHVHAQNTSVLDAPYLISPPLVVHAGNDVIPLFGDEGDRVGLLALSDLCALSQIAQLRLQHLCLLAVGLLLVPELVTLEVI